MATGDNFNGQCNVYSWSNIQQISAGAFHTVGLKYDGTVVAVGHNEYGQCNVESWNNIAKISSKALHTVGIKNDGTVVAVGFNKYGQCDLDNWSDIHDITTTCDYTVGLKSDGTVIATGDYDDYRQCFRVRFWDLKEDNSPSEETLPLSNQPITKPYELDNIYNQFKDVEAKDEYETKEEYIERVSNFYDELPIYFFLDNNINSDSNYNAETKQLTFSNIYTVEDKGGLGDDKYKLSYYYTPFKKTLEPIKLNLSVEKAKEIRENLALIQGYEFKYVYNVDDFKYGFPKGVAYSKRVEVPYIEEYRLYEITGLLRSITLYNTKNNNILYQKHNFKADSPVWAYSIDDQEINDDNGDSDDDGGGGGGGCFISNVY